MLRVNDEPEYNSFMHLFSPDLVKSVQFLGHAEVSFIGFGPTDMTAAPEVGFNLTYVCPDGQVFNHDWFATPFVMMTCQVLETNQIPIKLILKLNCFCSGKW